MAGDPGILERVLANLIDNAIKHSPRGGAVHVGIARADEVVITVRDEGPGIPADHGPHLFTRFFRGDHTKPRPDGTGLGLAIARAGAEAHGGRLEFVGNAPGATFRLTLPLRTLPYLAAEAVTRGQPSHPPGVVP